MSDNGLVFSAFKWIIWRRSSSFRNIVLLLLSSCRWESVYFCRIVWRNGNQYAFILASNHMSIDTLKKGSLSQHSPIRGFRNFQNFDRVIVNNIQEWWCVDELHRHLLPFNCFVSWLFSVQIHKNSLVLISQEHFILIYHLSTDREFVFIWRHQFSSGNVGRSLVIQGDIIECVTCEDDSRWSTFDEAYWFRNVEFLEIFKLWNLKYISSKLTAYWLKISLVALYFLTCKWVSSEINRNRCPFCWWYFIIWTCSNSGRISGRIDGWVLCMARISESNGIIANCPLLFATIATHLISAIISSEVTEFGPAIRIGFRGWEILVKKSPVWVANRIQSSMVWKGNSVGSKFLGIESLTHICLENLQVVRRIEYQ